MGLVKHGLSNTRTHIAWRQMRGDARQKTIPVTSRWNNFLMFLKDMGAKPVGAFLCRRDYKKGWNSKNTYWRVGRQKNAPLYAVWSGMMQRCYYVKHRAFANYGGRGISVCKRWHRFENFVSDMSPRPAGLTLDRINNSGHYSARNCRWSSHKEQVRNRRNTILYRKGRVVKSLWDWLDVYGLERVLRRPMQSARKGK